MEVRMSALRKLGPVRGLLLVSVAGMSAMLGACASTEYGEPSQRTYICENGQQIDVSSEDGKGPELVWTDPTGNRLSCRDEKWAMSEVDAPRRQYGAVGLGGTSWRLVEFRSPDGTATVPPRLERYRITFNTDGTVAMQLDCNRANGSWQTGPGSERGKSLSMSAGAMTRAYCGESALDSRIAQDMAKVRSYRLGLGRLNLVLEGDSGVYLWEPAPATS
jgi:heat shock protein HslJ